MNLLAAGLLAASVTGASQWSIVVTRTGDVAPTQIATVRQSLVNSVEAQAACGLGAYLPPARWKTTLPGRAGLEACTGQSCLEKLANDIGVDRLVALRFKEGVEQVLVAISLSDVHGGTLEVLDVTELSANADAEVERLAQTLCAVRPGGAKPTPPRPVETSSAETLQRKARPPLDVPAPTPTTIASPSSDARRSAAFLQKTYETAVPISAGVATSGVILSGVFMSIGAWQTAALRETPQPSGGALRSAIDFGNMMNTAAYTSAGIAVVAAAVGTTAWFLAQPGPAVGLSVDPAGSVRATISGEF